MENEGVLEFMAPKVPNWSCSSGPPPCDLPRGSSQVCRPRPPAPVPPAQVRASWRTSLAQPCLPRLPPARGLGRGAQTPARDPGHAPLPAQPLFPHADGGIAIMEKAKTHSQGLGGEFTGCRVARGPHSPSHLSEGK